MATRAQMIDRQLQDPRRFSRRFSTPGGWHEVEEGVYALRQKTLTLSFAHEFDLEQCSDDGKDFVALDKADLRNSGRHISLGHEDPSDKSLFNEARGSVTSEKPYHVYSSKQKWVVVVLIGVAGLFSGLSSNIYFPSLDAIAKVSRVLVISHSMSSS